MNSQITSFFAILCLSLAAARSPPKPGCEHCPGPSKYYNEIGCEPVFKDPGDCCPEKWNCDKLKGRPKNKCYAFGVEYNINDELREEDKGCRQSCKCIQVNEEGSASWACAQIGIQVSIAADCYRPRNATMCFPGPEICDTKPEDIAKCEVDGETYYDGMRFESKEHPHKTCWCGPGWKGEFELPFCKDWTQHKCGFELDSGSKIEDNCAPVWHVGQDASVSCNREWRCGKDGDKITEKKNKSADPPAGLECKLGELTMKRDDEVNREDGDDCIKCRCDIPPVPTCMRLPKSACSGNLDDDSSEEEH